MNGAVYQQITDKIRAGKKMLAVLIDPDKTRRLDFLLDACEASKADLILVGGSLITRGSLDECITHIRQRCSAPVVIFPGGVSQVSRQADALLLLSVISGRNADLLIGRHVQAAPLLRESGLEIIPTGYMLIESGRHTAAVYMSGTQPIPRGLTGVAASTALAGEQLGLKMIYLEAGSGADEPVSAAMIRAVRESIRIPLLAGGGVRSAGKVTEHLEAGADIVVVGNILEEQPELLREMAAAAHTFKQGR